MLIRALIVLVELLEAIEVVERVVAADRHV